jgi:hypothetical protein
MRSAAQGLNGPCRQPFRILNDIHGHFIIGLERLRRIWAKGFHAELAIGRDSVVTHSKV